ncbi:hypothetical protein LJR186_001239 [Microbacterium foliorum]
MATVTGDVSTWGVDAFPADERLLVIFVPSSAATGSGLVLPLRRESIEPAASGTFAKGLVPTTELLPECWYTVRFEWFEKHPITSDWKRKGWSDLPGKLRVPPEGGDIATLFEADRGPKHIPLYFGYGLPPDWLPSGGVYYDLDDPEGAGVYSEGQVV